MNYYILKPLLILQSKDIILHTSQLENVPKQIRHIAWYISENLFSKWLL
jgi:hypothetical protein